MPLPPVGPCSEIGSSSGSPLKDVLSQVIAYMKIQNRGSKVTRIENIPADLKEEMQQWGYTVIPKNSDYLYRTADLIHHERESLQILTRRVQSIYSRTPYPDCPLPDHRS